MEICMKPVTHAHDNLLHMHMHTRMTMHLLTACMARRAVQKLVLAHSSPVHNNDLRRLQSNATVRPLCASPRLRVDMRCHRAHMFGFSCLQL